MNEKGFASLTALAILLILAYLIRGTDYTAGLFVEMTNNFETENRLQLAADSALANELNLCNGKAVDDMPAWLSTYPKDYPPPDGVDSIVVAANKISDDHIIILAVAKKVKYFGNGLNAFRAAGGFLEKNTVDGNDIYKSKGYLSK